MAEDDIVEVLWHNGQLVRRRLIQIPTSDKPFPPPPVLLGSGSGGGGGGGGGGEENAPIPQQQPFDQRLFIQEDEMASWLHHQNFSSDFLYSNVGSSLATQSHSSLSPAPPPPLTSHYAPSTERPIATGVRWPANFMNFSRLRGNTFTGGRVEPRPLIPVIRNSPKVGSSATSSSSSSAAGSCLTPATHSGENRSMVTGRVSPTFAVPGLSRKDKAVTIEKVGEIAGTSSSRDSKAETEMIQTQPPTETRIADDRKRKEKEETTDEIEETRERRGSIARKRSRAAETHNLSERRRREKINEKMKALQELIPRCNKTDKASMLDDAIEYLKSLQMQLQMMMEGSTVPMMYPASMQHQFMPHMPVGMMGMNRPPFIPFPGMSFPRQAHMAGLGPSYSVPRYPIPNIQVSDPSRVHLITAQPNPMLNHPQFPAYMNPYSQFVGLPQMQQPPPSQNQTTSQLSFSQASSSKEPDDQTNQPKG